MALDLSERTQNRIGRVAMAMTFAVAIAMIIAEFTLDPMAKQALKDVLGDFAIAILFCIAALFFILGVLPVFGGRL